MHRLIAFLLYIIGFLSLAVGIVVFYKYLMELYPITYLLQTIWMHFLPVTVGISIFMAGLISNGVKNKFKQGIFWFLFPIMFSLLLLLQLVGLEKHTLLSSTEQSSLEYWVGLISQGTQFFSVSEGSMIFQIIQTITYGIVTAILAVPLAYIMLRLYIRSWVTSLVPTLLCVAVPVYFLGYLGIRAF